MRRPEFIARQARCPTGLLGRFLARIMAVETAAENAAALELLDLEPGDHVLDVGCGHGRTLARAATLVPQGHVAGVDVSAAMVRMAAHWNRRLIGEGRIDVRQADSSHLPYPDRRFDKVYSVHTIYFWPDPLAHLQELRRVMKHDGCLVLGFRSRDDERAVADLPASVYRFSTSEEVRVLLEAAGFEGVRMVSRRVSARMVVFGIAQRDAGGRSSRNCN